VTRGGVLPVGLAAFCGCAALLLSDARRPPRLLFNTTASAPIGLYAIEPGRFHTGDLVAVFPPSDLARWMAVRGYLPANVPLLKTLVAERGARVCGGASGLTVNGRWLAKAQPRDHWGRRLPRFDGCQVLSADDVLLINAAAPNSLDSRYFGPVPRRGVVGRARPLWTREARR